jgi:hypothetical protein
MLIRLEAACHERLLMAGQGPRNTRRIALLFACDILAAE